LLFKKRNNDIVNVPLSKIIKITNKESFRGPDKEALKWIVYLKQLKGWMDMMRKFIKNLFIMPLVPNGKKRTIRYLAFEGPSRVLINTKNKTAYPHIEWVKQTLFTAQIETPKQAVPYHTTRAIYCRT
jgi:hypothetical protein